MSGIELICINLDESAASGGKKFWKTCTFRTFCTRQSWERTGLALRSGALSEIISAPNSHLAHPFALFPGLAGCPPCPARGGL